MTTRKLHPDLRRRALAKGLLLAPLAGGVRLARAESEVRALVIGAGMAGISAARTLEDAGVGATIIEARERIGGRIWSDDSLGATVDMGGAWIHGTRFNPLTRMARRQKIETSRTDYDDLVAFDRGRRMSERELADIAELAGELEYYIDRLDVDGDISLQAAVDRVLAAEGATAEERHALRFALSPLVTEAGANLSELSLVHADAGDGFGGGDVLFPGGYRQLVDGLATGLDLRLGQPVQQVEYGLEGVRVTTATGRFEADGVISTLPLGVMKAGAVRFSPGLPKAHAAAIDRLGMGVLDKVALRFPESFWETRVEFTARVPDVVGEFAMFLHLDAHVDAPIIVALCAGDFARENETRDDRTIVATVMKALRECYGAGIPDPEAFVISRWWTDPFAGGSYSHLRPGSSPSDREALTEPLGAGRVRFAGEHTTTSYPGTVHGAHLTGIREAEAALADVG
ncbi:MAG: FAD-dependent oxidoreductase [Pseudomonadota bacterium]